MTTDHTRRRPSTPRSPVSRYRWLMAVFAVGWSAAALAQPRPDAAPRVSVRWTGAPVRTALEKLADAQGFTCVLDRRVDPGSPVDVDLSSAAPEQAVAAVARACQCESIWLGETAFIGPPSAVRTLSATTTQGTVQLRSATADVRKRLTARADMEWKDLATPREIVAQLAKDAQLRLDGNGRIPHDLWAQGRVDNQPWNERTALVLAQFDLTWSLGRDGKSLVIERVSD